MSTRDKEIIPRMVVSKDRSKRGGIVRQPMVRVKGISPTGSPAHDGLKVLAHIHLYAPTHNAGAEWMIHALLRYGVERRNWDVQVITDHMPVRNDTWQGIRVRHDRNVQRLNIDYRFSNVIITHLDVTRKAMEMAGRAGRPLVHMVHNDRQLAFHKVQRRNAALVIFNSNWIKDIVPWDGPSVVLHPPTQLADYAIDPVGEEVSMLNLSLAKGASTFFEVAQSNPSIRFLGVKGSYGAQEHPKVPLDNLEIIENQAEVARVYERTRVLLVPSHYESWGRVAVEAACSGIPSICAPTPGLIEAGVATAFCEPDDTEAWNKQLRRLIRSPNAWAEASALARERAEELDRIAEEQLEETAVMMESLG